MTTKLEDAISRLKQWQRHVLLRTYGDDGRVLPENLALSGDLDVVLGAVVPDEEPPRNETECDPIADQRMDAADVDLVEELIDRSLFDRS